MSRPTDNIVDLSAHVAKRIEETRGFAFAPWPEPIDLEELAKTKARAPAFIIPDWLPSGYMTLLAGHGGVGKSAIALHLASCIATGGSFFGLPCERRRVLYLSCEDRADVLHWRLARICDYRGITIPELAGQLDLIDLVGIDATLWMVMAGSGNVTGPYALLAEQVRERQTQVLFVDGVSDVYGANENDRPEVKRFVNAMLAMIPLNGALILLGHVAKAGAGTAASEGYSGSTQWHNAARARWYLYPETEQGEDEPRPRRTGRLLMDLQKSNLGQVDRSLAFRWDEEARAFVGEGGGFGFSTLDRKTRESTERQSINRALNGSGVASLVVPAAMQGRRTAFNVLVMRPEFPESLKRSPARFWRHIEHLRQIGHIKEVEYRRPDGHKAVQIVLTTEGQRAIDDYGK